MSQEALKMSLEALELMYGCYANPTWISYKQHETQILEQAKDTIKAIEKSLAKQEQGEPVLIDGNTSDGYHTFNELYEFRKAYNAALFNEWAINGKCSVHKSWRHNDGELCFGGGWFIVVAVLPDGQISNHYEAKDWNLFAVPETERALFEFDGHTGNDVIERLKAYTTPQQRTWVGLTSEEREQVQAESYGKVPHHVALIAAVEAKLKQKNGYAEEKNNG